MSTDEGFAEVTDVEAGARISGSGGGRRAFWTFVDQALSSLTNFALAILVARMLDDASTFGAFSLALITFSFTIGIGRGLISDPFVVRYSDAAAAEHRAATARATGAGIAFGLAAGLVCALAALLLRGSGVSVALLALAVSLPGLMVQDVWRHVFFAAGRPFAAAMNDLVWTVVQFVLLGVLIVAGTRSIFLITVAWGASALAAAVVGCLQSRVWPSPFATLRWFRDTRDLNVRMALDFALNMGAINLAIYVIAAIAGTAGAGALRAAQVLLGPLNLLYAGLSSFVLPVMSRQAGQGRSLVRTALATSLATATVAAGWLAILLLLPQSWGHEILKASWDGARSVMLASGIVAIAVGCVMGASLGLKALRRADQMLRVTFLQAPFMLGLGVLGAFLNGAVGAAWGFAGSQLFGLIVCWAIFLRADRLPRDWIGQPEEPAGPPAQAPAPSLLTPRAAARHAAH